MDPSTLIRVLVVVVAMLLSTAVHEYAHALAAFRLGDDYAAREGRLTLNPFAHADPVGTLLLPALGAAFWGGAFGWGKPVPYIPTRLTRKYSMRAGEAIIAFAGPFANLVLGTLATAVYVALPRLGLADEEGLTHLLSALISLNFMLFLFNLLPVPPLDGSKVVAWLFGARADRVLDGLQGMGSMGLLIAILLGGRVVGPMAAVLTSWVFGAFRALGA